MNPKFVIAVLAATNMASLVANRKLKRQRFAIACYAAQADMQVNYLLEVLEKHEVTPDEFDLIVINQLFDRND